MSESFKKTTGPAPKLSSLAESSSLPLETADNWLLEYTTPRPLTLAEFVNKNVHVGDGKKSYRADVDIRSRIFRSHYTELYMLSQFMPDAYEKKA